MQPSLVLDLLVYYYMATGTSGLVTVRSSERIQVQVVPSTTKVEAAATTKQPSNRWIVLTRKFNEQLKTTNSNNNQQQQQTTTDL